jgi:hypothetical protein
MRAVRAPILARGVSFRRFGGADLQRLAQFQTRFEEERPVLPSGTPNTNGSPQSKAFLIMPVGYFSTLRARPG